MDMDMDTTSTTVIPPGGVPSTGASPISVAPTIADTSDTKPYDTESLNAWYNIVLIDVLTEIVGNLNAKGEVCLHISKDGKAYANTDADENENMAIIYDFGELPNMTLWSHIIDRLGDDGLFAEVREIHNENCIFISWAQMKEDGMKTDMSYIECSLARTGRCDECDECVADNCEHLFIEMAEFYDGLQEAGKGDCYGEEKNEHVQNI